MLFRSYFDRMGVRLHYQARDMAKYGDDAGKLKEFCELSCDILALASLIHPFHRAELESGEEHVCWAIANLFALYQAAEALLVGHLDCASSVITGVKGGARPDGWGSTHSSRFDKHIKGLMEAAQ